MAKTKSVSLKTKASALKTKAAASKTKATTSKKKTDAPKKASKTPQKRTKVPRSMPAAGRDPKGGLTEIGREYYRLKEGANLKPGVKGPADTPEKMRRKGSFLTRMFTHPRGPMVRNGKPTRLALSAVAWGEPIPKTVEDAYALAAEGRKLLDRYRVAKKDAGKRLS
ncbi:MAG TPA: DUF6321 domain-containing protein [Edaphobacter sp.]|jgi:hypothetical protein